MTLVTANKFCKTIIQYIWKWKINLHKFNYQLLVTLHTRKIKYHESKGKKNNTSKWQQVYFIVNFIFKNLLAMNFGQFGVSHIFLGQVGVWSRSEVTQKQNELPWPVYQLAANADRSGIRVWAKVVSLLYTGLGGLLHSNLCF